MSECPTCGEVFDSDGGMKIHHYYKHDESIAKEQSECEICGKSFEYYTSEKKGLYCETCVENEQYRDIPDTPSGEENHRYSKQELECAFCGSNIYRCKSLIKQHSNNFCDIECYGDWRSKNQNGKENPNYVDGRSKTELYKGDWSKNRKKALNRDNHTCQKCGKTKEEIGKNPDVHHKIPIREFENVNNGHKIENLICLCPECHYEEERGWSNGKTEDFQHN